MFKLLDSKMCLKILMNVSRISGKFRESLNYVQKYTKYYFQSAIGGLSVLIELAHK
jgi:hypothetical protein